MVTVMDDASISNELTRGRKKYPRRVKQAQPRGPAPSARPPAPKAPKNRPKRKTRPGIAAAPRSSLRSGSDY